MVAFLRATLSFESEIMREGGQDPSTSSFNKI